MTRAKLITARMLLLAVLAAPPAAPAQVASNDSSKVAAIRPLLERTRVAEVILEAMEAAVPAQRAANPEIPDVFWEEFTRRARGDVQTLVDSIVPSYERLFTLEEVEQLLAFYATPIGTRLIEAQPTLTREGAEMGQRWGARLGGEVALELGKRSIRVR